MRDRDADDWDRGKEHARQEREERDAHQIPFPGSQDRYVGIQSWERGDE